MLDESRFRKPAISDSRSAVAGPIPVGSFEKCIRQSSNLNLVGCIAIEISTAGKRTCEQKSRVDGRKLTLPDAAACFDVQEMVEEAFVARSVRFGTLRALKQIAKSRPSDLCSEISKDDAALNGYRDCGQRHAAGCNTYWSFRISFIADQPIIRVGFVKIIEDGRELQQTQVLVRGWLIDSVGEGYVGHAFSFARSPQLHTCCSLDPLTLPSSCSSCRSIRL